MLFRVVACILLASAVAAGQSRIERGATSRVPGGRISQVLANAEHRGTMIPVNGRRTTVVRIDNVAEAARRGFTANQLAALGIAGGAAATANALIGVARDSDATLLPDMDVRLRELRAGQVVSYARTDAGGRFAFPGLPPGTYVVELMTPQGAVVALSDALSIGAGEIVQTVVQMTAPTRSFAGWVGGATTSAVNSAVEAGVLALEPAPAASPEN
jgi:hypothetical protein